MEGYKRVDILGCPFDVISYQETVNEIRKAVLNNNRIQFVPGSIDFVMKARCDPVFAHELWRADCLFADGVPIVWAASILGNPIRGRVSGTDIAESCARISSDIGCSVALIGGRYEIVVQAANVMKKRYSGSKLFPIPTPFSLGEKENKVIVLAVKNVDGKIVLVALGAPRQERWVQANLAACEANVGIGIGSAFDIISGDKPRAPTWMADHGFEWLYRMLLEPRRLGKRYIVDDSPFLFHLGIEIIRKRVLHTRSEA